jgi:NADH-quinone oxidoreductase subunit N
MISIAMLALAGLPPLPGFAAKFLVFKIVLAAGYTAYAVAGLVASYLGIYFYLRVIQYMFMGAAEPAAATGKPRRLALLATVLCVVPAILLSFFPGWLLDRL